VLLDGINHIGMLTDDTARLVRFYEEVFDATVSHQEEIGDEGTLTMIDVGPHTELNVFELRGDDAPDVTRGSMFTHGPIDHVGLQATDREAFVEIRKRLMERGATDGFVTDFGRAHSVWFKDPDGLEGEVILWIRRDGPVYPPGTAATGYDS
jgi:catechol 2,3-dioxygenase-like lactoylglutathione lyase family enzyme